MREFYTVDVNPYVLAHKIGSFIDTIKFLTGPGEREFVTETYDWYTLGGTRIAPSAPDTYDPNWPEQQAVVYVWGTAYPGAHDFPWPLSFVIKRIDERATLLEIRHTGEHAATVAGEVRALIGAYWRMRRPDPTILAGESEVEPPTVEPAPLASDPPVVTQRVPATPQLAEPPAETGAPPVQPRLASRHKNVLRCLASNLSNPQIADQLKLPEKTIKDYCTQAFQIIGVTNREDAGEWARRNIDRL